MILFRWIAFSTMRLAIAAVLALGILFGVAPWIVEHVREVSTSVASNALFLSAWLFTLPCGTLFLSIIVADSLLPHRWRERVVLGLDVELAEQQDKFGNPVLPKSHMMPFSLIFIAIIAAASWGVDRYTEGFLSEYQQVGHKLTILRGDNEPLKHELLKELADVRRQAFVNDALDLLDRAWRDSKQTTEVRRTALLSLGRLSHSLVGSVNSWSKEGYRSSWELDLLRSIRRRIAPDIMTLYEQNGGELKVASAYFLGKVRDDKCIHTLMRRVNEKERGFNATWIASVAALGKSKDTKALESLITLSTQVEDVEAFKTLCYAVGEISRHYIPETDKAIDALFEPLLERFGPLTYEGTFNKRCSAVDVLRKTGHAHIASYLFKAFDTKGADGMCPMVQMEVGEKAPEVVIAEEPFRLRILRALGLIAKGNQEVIEWTHQRRKSGSYGEFIQGQLRELLKLLGEPIDSAE
jgi:hypothetical protein